ncbi:MAG: PorP/SprF family type IX secretion system membrane protein [Cytophagales bacterium]|nr:PorP/SprF family type IX secretion system membrane protein [Cytophagales bacterium]
MERFRQYFVLIFIFLGQYFSVFAQKEPIFSQFYASSIYLNPALSGLEHKVAFSGIHRSQWVGINPYTSSQFAVIVPYHDKGEKNYHKGGFGANILNSNMGGGINLLWFSINAAYNLHIAATTAQNITFGIQLGGIQMQGNSQNYIWGSSYDASTGTQNSTNNNDANYQNIPSKFHPEVGAGLLYYYNAGRNIYQPGISAYFGFAASHLTRPNESYVQGVTVRAPILLKFHGGIEIHVAKNLNFSPNYIYVLQASDNMLMAGGNFTYLFTDHEEYLRPTKIAIGSSYRFNDGLVFLLGFGNKHFNLGLSYDFGTSALSKSGFGTASTYEISFKTTVHFSKKTKKSSKFHTPLM